MNCRGVENNNNNKNKTTQSQQQVVSKINLYSKKIMRVLFLRHQKTCVEKIKRILYYIIITIESVDIHLQPLYVTSTFKFKSRNDLHAWIIKLCVVTDSMWNPTFAVIKFSFTFSFQCFVKWESQVQLENFFIIEITYEYLNVFVIYEYVYFLACHISVKNNYFFFVNLNKTKIW